jgi:hypothetical protein
MVLITLSRVALLSAIFSSIAISQFVACRVPISTDICKTHCNCYCLGANLICNFTSSSCNASALAACKKNCVCALARGDTESEKSVAFAVQEMYVLL